MFKLEKVFQNDDTAYIIFVNFFKSVALIISFYIFSILEKNSIYELFEVEIYLSSKFSLYSFIFFIIYFINTFILNQGKIFKKNFISFLREDLLNIILSNILIFAFYFIFKINFEIDGTFLASLIFLIFNLFLLKMFFNYLYKYLVDSNVIQKNIMLVGNYNDILKILNDTFDKIYVFKCCIILDLKNYSEKLIKSEIKLPIFKNEEDIRSILEYHALGQVWLLESNDINIKKALTSIIKYSVDILILKFKTSDNLTSTNLIGNKYEYKYFEISKFHGVNLFIKILIDKFFSILFLLISSPILILSMIFIYLEDGYPLIFTQNRTGWDGRRFKIYKLRTLKKQNFDKTVQVTKDDNRVLKIGRIIRRYSIDELPQFYNVLIGDMSIVGPRPHMVEHDIKYSILFQNFLKRHKCNPGLTGWAQVNGHRGATPDPEFMKRRMDHDLWYLNNWNIFLDLYIIFKTFYVIFRYKGD